VEAVIVVAVSPPFQMQDLACPSGNPFAIERIGVVMRPRRDEPCEKWGVVNPACARGPDGALYLFPREVAEGNCSRIGRARVRFSRDGQPVWAERLGVALDPTEPYEHVSPTLYGCEDPRVTFVPALNRYVMTYDATTHMGPRVALAVSQDLVTWQKLGLADFLLDEADDLNMYDNKDAMLFPEPVPGPDGHPMLALLHRPMYEILPDLVHEVRLPAPGEVLDKRQSIWISYCDLTAVRHDITALRRWTGHHLLATPVTEWERLKIGAGAPPLLTHLGWLLVYHGVSREDNGRIGKDGKMGDLTYSAGVLILDRADPRRILYRSPTPILAPEAEAERTGTVPNVVFPSGLDPHMPIGPGSRVDVYYGMADWCVGAGWLTLPETLPDVS
jgi:beta-1,2-mannobiose phosphorylase / 1,2-beta-oligomannan phosphorylase